MKLKNTLSIVALLVTIHLIGQGGTSTSPPSNVIALPHQEQVYLKANTSLAFVGEYVYYSIYNLKAKTGLLSGVSKVAYLKLVNEDGEVVLNHKIKLIGGMGDSNFFIPSSIPSGNYKLVAYTQWMLNNGASYFYSQDLTIINPYTSNQAVFRSEITDSLTYNTLKNETPMYGNVPLQLKLDKKEFGLRELVQLELLSLRSGEGYGNYVISVRKVDELNAPDNRNVLDYQKTYPAEKEVNNLILPELRGELITGSLIHRDTQDNLNNVPLAVSFPGEDYLFDIVTTKEDGHFFLNVNKDYNADNMYVQSLANSPENHEIVLNKEVELDFSSLKFHSFKLNREMDEVIKTRSVHNQIENAYYSSKPDTILLANRNKSFYGPEVMEYILDEYTRFSTVKETFVEVVEHVWLQNNEEGRSEFHVRPEAPYVESGKLPLVIVDGILVLDHELVLGLSASRINTISISRKNHFYGTKTFQGVVDIKTFKGDYFQSYYTSNLFSQELFKPNESKNYYRQSYRDTLQQKYDRLPDFRYQLLWLPKYEMKLKTQNIEFFTSDIKGDFEVILEGFTQTGKPVVLKESFRVQ